MPLGYFREGNWCSTWCSSLGPLEPVPPGRRPVVVVVGGVCLGDVGGGGGEAARAAQEGERVGRHRLPLALLILGSQLLVQNHLDVILNVCGGGGGG